MDAIQASCSRPCQTAEQVADQRVTLRSDAGLRVAVRAGEGGCREAEPTTRVALKADSSVAAKLATVGESGDEQTDAALRYSRTEKTSIMIRTQEGDIVRLRFGASEKLDAETSTAAEGETQLTELDIAARSSTRLGVFVKGDLSSEELTAIRSVVEQAGSLASDFFAGDTAGAFAAAAELAIDGRQLAKVALRLRIREEMSYSQSGPVLAPPARASAAAAGGSEVPASTASVTAAPAAAAPPDPADAAATEGAAAAATEPVETGADEAGAAAALADPFAFMSSVLGFLARLMESFEPVGGAADTAPDDDRAGPGDAGSETGQGTVAFSLKLRIFSSIVARFAADASEPGGGGSEAVDAAAVETLSAAVETMAAESEPAWEAVA